MRAYLIDATIRTITEFDYIDEFHEPAEILGGNGRGNFTLGSGTLAPPVLDDSADGFLGGLHVCSRSRPRAMAGRQLHS